MATNKGQAVAPVSASGNLPADMDLDFIMQDSGAGVSNMGAGDVGIPYIAILQGLSPQVNRGLPAYIKGAEAGMFYNTATQEVTEGPLNIVPCAYERKYVEWVPREKGGGWVADYDIDSDIMTKTHVEVGDNGMKRNILPNGNLIIETAYHYCLSLTDDGRISQVVIPLKSTMLKSNRKWNRLIADTVIPGTNKVAPRWLFPYEVSSIIQTKGSNNWFVADVRRLDSPVDKDTYLAGRHFNELFNSGKVERTPEPDGVATEENLQSAGSNKAQAYDEEDDPFNQR